MSDNTYFIFCEPNSVHVCSEVSPIIVNGAYFQVWRGLQQVTFCATERNVDSCHQTRFMPAYIILVLKKE